MTSQHAGLAFLLVLLAAALAGDQAGRVSGRVLHRSDVQTLPDAPYLDGMVLAIRSADLERLPQGQAAATGAGFPMGPAEFRQLVTASQRLGKEGVFSLRLPPGAYVLCVANLGEPPPAPPIFVQGCVRIDATTTGHRLDLLFGEGGLVSRAL